MAFYSTLVGHARNTLVGPMEQFPTTRTFAAVAPIFVFWLLFWSEQSLPVSWLNMYNTAVPEPIENVKLCPFPCFPETYIIYYTITCFGVVTAGRYEQVDIWTWVFFAKITLWTKFNLSNARPPTRFQIWSNGKPRECQPSTLSCWNDGRVQQWPLLQVGPSLGKTKIVNSCQHLRTPSPSDEETLNSMALFTL